MRSSARASRFQFPVLVGVLAVLLGACNLASAPTPVPWSAVNGIPGVAGASFAGIVANGGTLVVVGGIPRSSEVGHAAAWRSTDGHTWTQAPDDAIFSQRQMLGVAAGRSGVMAVGSVCAVGECSGSAVWTSPDALTWHEAAPMPIVGGFTPFTLTVAAGSDRWLVGGTAYGLAANDPRVPGIWTTVDGTSWTAATIPALGEGMSGTVAGFARSATTTVAVGSITTPNGGAAAVWTSKDELTWTRAADDPTFGNAVINAVVAGGPGFVAVGRDDSGAAVWLSTDGSAWQKVAPGPGFHGAQMTAVAAGNGLLTAVGSDGNGALVWRSPDGRTWTSAGGAASMTGAKAVGVAVGSTDDVVVGAVPGSAAMWSRDH